MAEVFADPQHPYTEALLRSIPLLGMRYTEPLEAIRGMVPSPLDWPDGCRFAPRCDYAFDRCRTEDPHLLPVPPQESACWLCDEAARASRASTQVARVSVAEDDPGERAGDDGRAPRGTRREEVLPRQARASSSAPSGQLQAVDGVDLDVYRGETVGLVGESGCGKSTLGRTLLRLLEPTAGTVALRRRRHHGPRLVRASRPTRRHMQIVFQDSVGSLDPRMKVRQLVGEGLKIHGLGNTAGARRGRARHARARRPAARGRRPLPAPVLAVASASGSASPARSSCSRSSSSPTSPSRRSTCRSSRRCSTCSSS